MVHTVSRTHLALLKDKQTYEYLRRLRFCGMTNGVGKLIKDVSEHFGHIVKAQHINS